MQGKKFRGRTRAKTVEVRKYAPWQHTPRGHQPIQLEDRFYLLLPAPTWLDYPRTWVDYPRIAMRGSILGCKPHFTGGCTTFSGPGVGSGGGGGTGAGGKDRGKNRARARRGKEDPLRRRARQPNCGEGTNFQASFRLPHC